ncbi:protein LplC [Clostridia bacterium]|nr:protein LplC [Clostridia bacterium]
MSMTSRNQTTAGRVFDAFNYGGLFILAAVMVAPLIYCLIGSFSVTGMSSGKFVAFSTDAYRMIFQSGKTLRSIGNSFLITVVGTLINIVMTSTAAYALSKPLMPGHKLFTYMVVFFMLFSAGLIPDFIVIANKLHLKNTYWSVWFPVAISSYNLIVMRNFYKQLPESIEESARIDGCNELQSFIRIVVPMSKASLATFSLFYAVGHWNNYIRPMIYLDQSEMWPITVWLRQIVILSLGGLGNDNMSESEIVWAATDAVKYSTIIVSTVPILCVYPFLQKHFAKGVLVGSVKG